MARAKRKSRKRAEKTARRKYAIKPQVTDSLEMQNDKARFEPVIPQIAGKLSPEQSKLDQFERFAKAIKQVESIQRYKLKQAKKFSALEKSIMIAGILLAINLVWILIMLI